MRVALGLVLSLLTGAVPGLLACHATEDFVVVPDPPIRSTISNTPEGGRVLLQEVYVRAPRAVVWDLYTTSEGWRSWVAPAAEVELAVGGRIRTHYTPGASLGDPGTNVLRIVNYAAEEFVTLQAELADNWPEVMKQDAENLTNVILFDALAPELTRVRSFGLGYRDAPEYDALLDFFVPANERLLTKLVEVAESR